MQPNTCKEEGHLDLIDDEQTYLPEILIDDEKVGDGIYIFLLSVKRQPKENA
ncbi:MAG: hypothetical protein WCO53_11590 [Deltaproteobacteria bacterium]